MILKNKNFENDKDMNIDFILKAPAQTTFGRMN